MNNTTHYLFFLEPYTFIFHQKQNKVLYNTLNAAYISCPKSTIVDNMLDRLNDPKNGYCIHIPQTTLNDPVVNTFIKQVRDSFSGDLVEIKRNQKTPYIFKPALFFNYTPAKLEAQDLTLFGERILQNLNEVSFFLDNNCQQGCEDCNNYYKQTLHCASFDDNFILGLNDYAKILGQLEANQVERVNLLGGDWEKNKVLESLLPLLVSSSIKKTFYVLYSKLSSNSIHLLLNESCELVILLHPDFNDEMLLKHIFLHKSKNIIWKFLVSSDQDILNIENLNIPEHIRTEIVPYYTSDNLDFFEENVFIELEDILEVPVNRQVLFRRSILNENFFGKLYVTPQGVVYANMNKSPLGNIRKNSLKELVYKELYNSFSWLSTRDRKPCSDCVIKLLCPSISNYELVMKRENLCKKHDNL